MPALGEAVLDRDAADNDDKMEDERCGTGLDAVHVIGVPTSE
jgi:hypothetical protein